MTTTENCNGSAVIAHDPKSGTNYVRLPRALWRSCGGCKCPHCVATGSEGFWDTLAVPTTGHAWTVHMPNPAEFRAYVAAEAAKKTAKAVKKVTKAHGLVPKLRPERGAPWE